MAWFYRSIIGVAVGFLVIVCGGECVSNAWHPARVDEWIPVCTGMTAGGADQFSHSVILANAGIHCIASAVARFWHFILRVVGFAFVVICGGECVSNAWHPALVDEWIPVCTGMTAGGADQFSHLVILANAGIHCIASAVAQFWRSIIGVVGFLVVVCGGECVANTRLLARVDEWIPVCTGMTAGGAV
ncbi:hypothetical protein [Vibrio vulnificus]|uniref:hypothetical protein n=1 Tax=Vibrio vulnificus TaxID=672 RepID=UPI0013EEC6B8|nr:hypothetical protein [Vibrio vulnificus]MCD1408214.1 hypothetical protein [Vibrio vulnificus]MCD1417290.1 hypothetical protein [Vibrio vulnificus]MCD1424178.1 hypothetical protein [Vibrio vulnificus]MCD1439199.1 hypothetical protein [Vibrio vulnificus]MCD1441305.1 hypothetical protein [Vibrio vulnificus]